MLSDAVNVRHNQHNNIILVFYFSLHVQGSKFFCSYYQQHTNYNKALTNMLWITIKTNFIH